MHGNWLCVVAIMSFVTANHAFRMHTYAGATRGLRNSRYISRSASSTSMSHAGSNFFERIGLDNANPIHVSAPMVEQSELAFRLLVKQHGAHLCFTQMMHAKSFATSAKVRANVTDWAIEHRDEPVIVQFAGDDAETLIEAAKHVQDHVAAVDLNLGCPQNIAKRGHYGAFLLEDQSLVLDILSRMVQSLNCPVTAKIRLLPQIDDTIEYAKRLQDTGISMLTVHGRTAQQKKQFAGQANWDMIRRIKSELSIPVIANGGIESLQDVQRCVDATGCDGAMSSEGLLENPCIFDPAGNQRFVDRYPWAQLDVADQYLDLCQQFPPPSLPIVKNHLFPLLYRFLQVHTDQRTQLASAGHGLHEFRAVVHTLRERLEQLPTDITNTEQAAAAGFISERTWYKRHASTNEQARQASSNSQPAQQQVEEEANLR